jgi:hypothetical protein
MSGTQLSRTFSHRLQSLGLEIPTRLPFCCLTGGKRESHLVCGRSIVVRCFSMGEDLVKKGEPVCLWLALVSGV